MRNISKFISSLLSNIVRADNNDDGINSKNIIPGNGKITTTLKKDWGLDAVWNELILPRYERMNQLTNTNAFTYWNEQYQKFLPVDTSPVDFKRIEKKRIDHRHHAMDALVIACMTRDHVNLLNNQSAKSETIRYDLQNKLRNKSKENWIDKKTGTKVERDVFKEFKKPWDTFTVDAKNALDSVVVSFKQNLRVINKATNAYQKWEKKNGVMVKAVVKQEGVNWAIRKPMHKETVSGKVVLNHIKVPKGKILTATRKLLDTSFDQKTIESITDTGIQKILKCYLASKDNNPEIAFSPEGIEDMNNNIAQYNDGVFHQPIKKVRIFESGNKFSLGEYGNKKAKYVEAAKGTNLYFAIYINEDGKRTFETMPLNIVIERLKQGLPPLDFKGENDFFLTPNDLVYVPNADEILNYSPKRHIQFSKENYQNIYKVVSFSGNQIFFVRHVIAMPIINKAEFSTLNKMERAIDGTMIKDVCIKLKIDRLGNASF